jgi:hypothetical protein
MTGPKSSFALVGALAAAIAGAAPALGQNAPSLCVALVKRATHPWSRARSSRTAGVREAYGPGVGAVRLTPTASQVGVLS